MTHICAPPGPTSVSTRSRISPAALFVKVIARISCGRDAHLVDEVGDAVGEDARLARARAGEHEQRPFGGGRRRGAALR